MMSDQANRAAMGAAAPQPPSTTPPPRHTNGDDDAVDRVVGSSPFGDRLWCSLGMDGPRTTTPARGLPMPQLWTPSGPPSAHYVVTAMDTWGRLADRSSVASLGWRPGVRLALTVTQSAVVAAPNPEGREAVTRQGHLRLPAPIRHLFRLAAGDRLLLAACHDRGFLVVYPIAILDAMVLAYHRQSAGGGATP
jgi:hypothetical protein